MLILGDVESTLKHHLITDGAAFAPLTPLTKHRIQMAFKEGTGVEEVLFGVGLGGGDAVKGFVEDGDDALLFGERGKRNS